MKTFEQLELISPLQRALADEQYTTPTPVQAQAVPPALAGRDVLGCAQTGTGKTAAFALPILNRLGQTARKAAPRRPLALVLAPTRELAVQIGESFDAYGKHLRLRKAVVYGGVSQTSQVRAMNRGVHILVATPGRLLDLMNQGFIELDLLEVFVLDEADRMLDMGFLPDLKRIISKLPTRRQSLFFSATMPPKIKQLSNGLLHDPVCVDVTPKKTSVEKIDQRVMFVEKSTKSSMLRKVLGAPEVDRALVFTRTKRGANSLADKLVRGGFRAAAIHGNKSQNARMRALDAFRSRKVQVLVATDVAARGIDIDGITHVVNFDVPVEPESYVHRIGRTGRAGAEGAAISFCTESEHGDWLAIERLLGLQVSATGERPKSTGQGGKGKTRTGAASRSRRGGGRQRQGAKGAPSRGARGRRRGDKPNAGRKPKLAGSAWAG